MSSLEYILVAEASGSANADNVDMAYGGDCALRDVTFGKNMVIEY